MAENSENTLFLKRKNAWDSLRTRSSEIENFSSAYKDFLNRSKTERECVETIRAETIFTNIEEFFGKRTIPAGVGNKIYVENRGKSIALAIVGRSLLDSGANIIASHIDSPCLHLKQIPLSEDSNSGLGIFRIHYYGGIKKYQWVSRPLALHGVVVKADGQIVKISIGEGSNEPVFFIPDILPHLARKVQSGRKIEEAVPGEKMNALAGSIPVEDKETKERIKSQILEYLHAKYGFVEEDLISAELILVPADSPRDVGFDRGLIAGYGHDDRSCAYASLRAILDIAQEGSIPNKTLIVLFFDKEEIGSEGNTSAKSNFLESVLIDLASPINPRSLIKTLRNSRAISADVSAGINPNWPEPHESTNAAKIGHGVVLTKFTGSGGKYSASDANAEYVGVVRRILNENKIAWQYAALGRVDEGGGGTIANFLAERGMEVIDVGVPVLSMHAPLEIVSKADLYETYRFYKAFLGAS